MSEAQIKENEAEAKPIVEDSEPLSNDNEADDNDAEVEERTVVSFGGEHTEDNQDEPAPEWAKNLRKQRREDAKEIKRLNKKLQGKTEEESPLGAKPTMEGLDYDDKRYEIELDAWNDKKKIADAKAEEEETRQSKLNANWDTRQSEYKEGQNAFDADDFEEAKEVVDGSLSADQSTIMVHVLGAGAANVVMGLGSNEKELEAISKIKDNFLFTAALVELKANMTVTKTPKPRFSPESKVGGSASHDLSDSTLNKLEAAAEKNNDYTALFAYKRKLRKS